MNNISLNLPLELAQEMDVILRRRAEHLSECIASRARDPHLVDIDRRQLARARELQALLAVALGR